MSDTPTIIRPDDVLRHKDIAIALNGTAAPQPGEKQVEPLSDHPLWPAFLEELAAIRKADLERDLEEFKED